VTMEALCLLLPVGKASDFRRRNQIGPASTLSGYPHFFHSFGHPLYQAYGHGYSNCVAFPVCESTRKLFWSHGKLQNAASYWHERDWTHWSLLGRINYCRVSEFRAIPFQKKAMKGVTEGSETVIEWPATFSTRTGQVESIQGQKVAIRRTSDRHNYTWTIRPNQSVFVVPGEKIEEHQVIAAAVKPVGQSELTCPGNLPRGHIANL
jgi:hypothetical protein